MKTPFTPDQFFSVFEAYNQTLFPAQILIFLLGAAAAFALFSSGRLHKNRLIAGVLALTWCWTGAVYHLAFFTGINQAAYGFGILFLLQGAFFAWNGVYRENLRFGFTGTFREWTGVFFIFYGLVIYPLIHSLLHPIACQVISYGLPCPTIISTFGFLILCRPPFPKYLLIIPSLWALIGISAAISLGVYQDLIMPMAAVTTALLVFLPAGQVNGKA